MPELFHVGLTVGNLERSIAFYRDVVGMVELDRTAAYAAGGGTTLDLHHDNVGSPRMSIHVDDVGAKFEEVRRRGDVVITFGLVQITPTMRSFYVEDPDGLPVEFL